MKKPRIIINMHYMALGGAERALLGLLNAIDTEKVDVDLFLNQHTGEFMPLIPKKINLLPENKRYKALETHIKEAFKDGCWGVASSRVLSKVVKYLYFKKHTDKKNDDGYISAKLTSNVEYDLAISFLTPHVNCLRNVRAKRKVAWIHTDYSNLKVTKNIVLPFWKQYDNIISISTDVTRSFVETFPSLKDKIIEIENILSPTFVRQQANLFDVEEEMPVNNSDEKLIKLLTIGRFCHQKNFDNLPLIAKLLEELGCNNFKWYIIGFGADESLIRKIIADVGIQEHVIILGKKTNPYPYIKACDIYVQPSRYEGKSVTVREAQMLFKPVVVTNYPTALSQVKNGKDGVIVPMDNEGCAKGIAEFIQNKKLQESINKYLQAHDYGNESEIEKVYKLLDANYETVS